MKMADKNKFALWMYPETLERVEKLYREDGCKSRSEFIEKAINFYCGYLTAENYKAGQQVSPLHYLAAPAAGRKAA